MQGKKSILLASVAVILTAAAGLHLAWFDNNQAGFRAFSWLNTSVGVACLVLTTFWITAWAMQGPGIAWQPYSDQVLQQAAEQKKPVIIGFYADWCTPCRELEEVTFHHPDVVIQAGDHFVMIKVDVTRGGNPIHERLLRQYGVKGVSTVIFLDARGKGRTGLRLVDFLLPEPFLGHMSGIRESVKTFGRFFH